MTIGDRKGSFSDMVHNREFRVTLVGDQKGFGDGETTSPDQVIPYTGKTITVKLPR